MKLKNPCITCNRKRSCRIGMCNKKIDYNKEIENIRQQDKEDERIAKLFGNIGFYNSYSRW